MTGGPRYGSIRMRTADYVRIEYQDDASTNPVAGASIAIFY
jgi:hypothetical protein